MFGGGNFTTMNMVLPGSYMNFISAARATTAVERGVVAVPMALSWGTNESLMTVTKDEFSDDQIMLKKFGYTQDAAEMWALRELFCNATALLIYKINSGEKATATITEPAATLATAVYSGSRGNAISIKITPLLDDYTTVETMVGGVLVDKQTVETDTGAPVDNEVVVFGTLDLATAATIVLTGGTDVDTVTISEHSDFLKAIEYQSFNILACPSSTAEMIALYVAYTKRLRDEEGAKFQTLVWDPTVDPDYEGVIKLKNKVTSVGFNDYDIIYWMAGLQAGCAVNASCSNKTYDGELEIDTDYDKSEFIAFLKSGYFMLHKVGANDVRTMEDFNSLTTFTDEKQSDFRYNRVIRVIDKIAIDIARIFKDKYMGDIKNNAAGRISLAADIVEHHQAMEKDEAISDFDAKKITAVKGEVKGSVVVTDSVQVTEDMSHLYMTVVVA